uniref:Uncharacterized protein n=1 Tax=Knipowitschia caucasica TaxID=637954 RepID=A0AAV2K7S1_KNICA
MEHVVDTAPRIGPKTDSRVRYIIIQFTRRNHRDGFWKIMADLIKGGQRSESSAVALHQPCISPASARHQPGISPASALHQPCISPASARHQPGISPASTLHQPCISQAR